MTDTTTPEDDRRTLAAAPLDSDDWDDATWTAWFRCAARAHGERFEGDTKPANSRILLGALLHSAQWAMDLTKQGQAQEASEHVDAIERLIASYRIAAGAVERDAIHKHFGLSYANYLVLPRTFLQSMPQEWQAQFVALLKVMQEAFAHVPQADVYDVTAGKEDLLRDMTVSELFAAGVKVTGDDDLGHGPETKYHRISDGEELDGDSYGFRPGKDPVPHYDRGRTRVEPRLGGGE